MLRVLAVLAALFLGLIGLAMSLCGGGVLLGSGLSRAPTEGPWVLVALGSTVIGVLLLWGAAKLLQRGTKPPGADG